jgi:hypothetical protein
LKNVNNNDHLSNTFDVSPECVKKFDKNCTILSKTCSQIDNDLKKSEKNKEKKPTKITNKSTISKKNEKNANKSIILGGPCVAKKTASKKLCTTIEIDIEDIHENANISSEKIMHKKYECECGKRLNSRQALWAHKKICDGIKIIDEKELEIKELKIEIAEMKELITKLINIQPSNNNNNNLTNTNSNNLTNTLTNNNSHNTHNTQKIVNVYQYVNSNYTDTPHIKMLDKKDVDKLLIVDENIKYTIEELLVFNQSKYVLDKFLGEIIKTAYKKEDPEEQQFWTSNVQKLTFIVRQLLNKKEKVWLQDSNGTCLVNHIIDPLLKEIKKMLQKYVKELEKNREYMSFDELDRMNNNGMYAVNIIYDINKKTLHQKILRYIAPHFQLEQSSLLLEN